MSRATMVLFCAFFVAAGAAFGQDIGRVVYTEGEVELVRDDRILAFPDLDAGLVIREMDFIQTGGDGYAEIELTGSTAALIRVTENSAYYLTVEERDGTTSARVKLLSGTVQVAANRMSRQSRLDVETRTAVFGVRGTEFDVLTAPDEASLLGVREGTVSAGFNGSDRNVQAGYAAEIAPDSPLRTEAVPDGDFQEYYARWNEIRLAAFRSGAPTFVSAYMRRYLDTRGDFTRTYRDLARFKGRLQDAVSNTGSLGSDMLLRREVSPAIIQMRSILPIFENTVYRLRELRRYHEDGIGRTTVDGQSSGQFFRDFSRQERDHIRQLGEVRTIFALYNQVERRSFGGLPGGGSDFLNNRPSF